MINPSIEGLVKIGKTTRHPDLRAKELSQATGVPTPFYVGYSIEVSDCHSAEEYVYAVLEHNGFKRSRNREFFEMTLRDAVQVLILAEPELRQQTGTATGDERAISSESQLEPSGPVVAIHPGRELLEKAGAVYFGIRDEIKDQDEALRLLYKAKSLNYAPAYTALADYFIDAASDLEVKEGFEGDKSGCLELRKKALEILTDGAQKGHGRCFVKMSDVYGAGGNFAVLESWPNEPENMSKCWKKYFRSATFVNDNDLKWGWGSDWHDGPHPQSRIDYSRWYLFNAFLGSFSIDPEIRTILLPLRAEIIADIQRSMRFEEEGNGPNPDNQGRNREFLKFLEETL